MSHFAQLRWNELKKMFFGGMLFVNGFIGVLIMVCISIYNQWDYNGITGLKGFLLGTQTMQFFILCCLISIIGILICVSEIYGKTIISMLKSLNNNNRRAGGSNER